MKTKKLLLTTLITGVMGLGGTAYAGFGSDGPSCDRQQAKDFDGTRCNNKQRGKHSDGGHFGGKHFCKKGFAGKGKSSAEQRVERMAEKLGLSDEQKQQVQSLMEQHQPIIQELREKMRELRKTLRSLDPAAADYSTKLTGLADQKASLTRELMITRGQQKQQLFSLLTPEQQTKMKAIKEKRMQRSYR